MIGMTICEFLLQELGQDNSGHDVAHAQRVVAFAAKIHAKEGGDWPYIEGCALLHDCLDSKLGLDTEKQRARVYGILLNNSFDDQRAKEMIRTMSRMSFHLHDEENLSLEDKIVRDADRLDAMGEVGARRALEYGYAHGRPFITEDNKKDIESGQRPTGESTVVHFFDKLLILDRYLYTGTAKELAVLLKQELIQSLRQLLLDEGISLPQTLLGTL